MLNLLFVMTTVGPWGAEVGGGPAESRKQAPRHCRLEVLE